MAENHMIYDFETALKALIDAQSDVMTLVQKWAEMVASDPRYVTFDLKGQRGDPGSYTVPNIQQIIEILNSRGFPPNPTFDSATFRGPGGDARLTNERLVFTGSDAGATYGVHGIGGRVWSVVEDTTVVDWPIQRYWTVKKGADLSVRIAPVLGTRNETHATDFFIHVPRESTITLTFPNPGRDVTLKLDPGATVGVWHVFMLVTRTIYGLDTIGRVTKMEV